ncbi:hypothetical protein M569_06873, partial [Genlisea aurea]
EDEAEIYDGVRAQFPLTFGKRTKSQTPLEVIHNATRRPPSAGGVGGANSLGLNKLSGSAIGENDVFPSLSTSSSDWLDAFKKSNPRTSGKKRVDEDNELIVGPPRPPPGIDSLEEEEDEPVIGPPRPPPGGDIAAAADDDNDDGPVIGPPRPPTGHLDSDSDDDIDLGSSGYRIPLSNEIILKGHTKVVSSLAVDHSGSRVLSGSYDYTVRMYDFQGMNARLQSFRQIEPFEGHQIRGLSWSPTSDQFLCITGSAQAKIYDRDGLSRAEFIKGDMYIRDLKNTKGHISGLTGGEWHPKSKETILTSSEDGSLRIWDVNDTKTQKQVIKPKLSRPGRVHVTTCTWDHEGKRVAGGVGDGSIQLWSMKAGWVPRPEIYIGNAHKDDITGLTFSSDDLILLSRSFDGSLKLFFTGTSVEKGGGQGGLLCFYDRAKLELISRVGVSPASSVVRCGWHPKLNQVFATAGDRREGGTHVLYDPTVSERGALACVARAPRRLSVDDFQARPVIHNPHALPLFRDEPSRKRQREKILKDPLKSHKPELPINGPGHGGRIGTTKGSLLTQYLLKQGGMLKETWMEVDPREAILKYADLAAKDPKFIAPAYAQTQPEPVFAKSDSDDDE